ncbi:FG-GAP-like repeat-containing protein [Cohnella ginsengisoli]|uniref:FG-GAP-like repeat-containing protein n=1 Tax=Cohnella ginsengisoli TaxID=425004 RepID=A0A9X4KH24_9BACL|nr:FG-GAP-like repeat-containing protein [Cohnella ginsengisoli]MDG0792149.1 FG-GAP-like repeat-containing protein [Cohnella ginsengisoli]
MRSATATPTTYRSSATGGDGTFDPPTFFPAGNYPLGIAEADFNKDGNADLAVVDSTSARVSVLYGDGHGAFGGPVFFAVGSSPRYVAADDFDGDGHMDLAVSNEADSNISVLLNNRDGTFTTNTYGSIAVPFKLVSGDLNGDGDADLAVVDNGSGGGAAVMFNHGDGSFEMPDLYPTGTHPIDIATGDFDGDNHLDLAVTNQWSTVSFLNGNGDGTFQAKSDLALAGYIATGDWNGDGITDLANLSGNTIFLKTSRAEGALTFSAPAFSVSEDGGSAIVTVNRTGSSYGQTKVRIKTSDISAIAGSDYTAVDATIVFNPGDTTRTYSIPVADNGVPGVDRTFGVTISAPTNEATLGGQTSATVTIVEDDPVPDTTAPTIDPTKFAAVDNYSGTPDRLAGAAAAVSEAGATVRAYRWNDDDTDGVVDAGELGSAIALGTSGADGSVPVADIGDLGPGTYKYVVTAEDTAGNESPRTAAAAVTVTLTKGLAPDVADPTWPSGSALSVSDVAYESAKLVWPAAADDRGVDHYELTQDGGTPVILDSATLFQAATGLAAGTSYVYAVVAVDAAGNRSVPLTATVLTATPTVPSQPSEASAEARLKLLEITAAAQPVALSPAFDMNVDLYGGATTESRIALNAAPLFPAATLRVNGESTIGKLPLIVDLTPGRNVIQIEVRAANGVVRVYSVTINRLNKPPVISCFSDIRGHWAEAEINEACALGLVKGEPDGLFRPNRYVTRSEWAVMVARWLNPDKSGLAAISRFADAAAIPAWAREAISAGIDSGIVKGYPDGTFRPSVTINRAETAAIIVRAAKWTADPAAVSPFGDDASIPSWAKPFAAAAALHAVLLGKEDQRFDASAPTTRAEAAAMLVRLSKLSQS